MKELTSEEKDRLQEKIAEQKAEALSKMKELTAAERAQLDEHYTEASSSVLGVSTGKRLANCIIDTVLLWGAITMLLIPFIATGLTQSAANNRLAGWLFGIFMFFLYYFVSETVLQRSPAKFITGTKVVMLDGSKPSAGTIAKRTLFRLMPFEAFSGLLNTWWHDSWSGTEVVSAKVEQQ